MTKTKQIKLAQSLSLLVSLSGLVIFSSPSSAQMDSGSMTPGTTTESSPMTPPSTTTPTSPTTTPSNSTPSTTTPTTPSTTTPAPVRPTPGNAPVQTSNQSLTQLLQAASGQGSFNTLAQAIQAAELTSVLQSTDGEFTIFAPTDQAFAALPAGTLDRLLRPENRDLLRQVLAYHVVPRQVTSSQLRTGGVSTLGGGIAVRVTPDRVIVNDASVVQADIQASNGVVHVVNRVLLPRALRQRLISLR